MRFLPKTYRLLPSHFLALSSIFILASAITNTQAVAQQDRYAPSRYGIPITISGYPVLGVLTENNFICMSPGERRLILQSAQPGVEDALRSFAKAGTDLAQWQTSIVGPGQTRDEVLSQLERARHLFSLHGCASLDIPNPNPCDQTTGECKQIPPYAGYAIIQNTDIHNWKNTVNAQSVVLQAPIVGHNQKGFWSDFRVGSFVKCSIPFCRRYPGYSNILNNGITNQGYLMQVGLYFTNKATIGNDGRVYAGDEDCRAPGGCSGDGLVVWVGALTKNVTHPDEQAHNLFSTGLNAKPATVPYVAGHEYYTTVTYTSGAWWTCAADTADPSTYECEHHTVRADPPENTDLGDHLVEGLETSVFVEVFDDNSDWAAGFNAQWAAHDARLYINGQPLIWSSEAVFTIDACKDPYPATKAIASAIDGSLVPFDRPSYVGWAWFNVPYVPPLCY